MAQGQIDDTRAAAWAAAGYQITARGLVFEQGKWISLETWLGVGRKIAQIINGSTWALGDWIAYGAGRDSYGKSYEHAITVTGRTYESLSQAARVSQAFPHHQRSVKVTWSHYREALRLPEVDRLEMLSEAEKEHWSRDRFSQEIERLLATLGDRPVREIQQVAHRVVASKQTGSRTSHDMRCPNCGHRWTTRRGVAAAPESR